ncbi:hypothetical protein ElyMa_001983400 [Elysia marginata]|uniref:Uncharacterized protein n=1 Tax=Elysia marginata TaxID=1093978 RepID=A0AAV4F134_9GAST|nr:hypothetical protein ElyMa_001983400 [Elysia marginata]
MWLLGPNNCSLLSVALDLTPPLTPPVLSTPSACPVAKLMSTRFGLNDNNQLARQVGPFGRLFRPLPYVVNLSSIRPVSDPAAGLPMSTLRSRLLPKE